MPRNGVAELQAPTTADQAALERPRFGTITRQHIDTLSGEVTLLRIYASELERMVEAQTAEIAALRAQASGG